MTNCAIMLGGNLSGTPQAMDFAVKKLTGGGFCVDRISRIFYSEAVDCVPGTPDFLDRAVTGRWNGSAGELLELCQSIETAAGRPVVHSSRESRILDLDIIIFGDLQISTPRLTVPHPRAMQREFVLSPLSEIAPEWIFPGAGVSVREALAALK